jgi:hypothetical protein
VPDNASAGTVAEAARADIVTLPVGCEQVPTAVKYGPDWNGRIVIDAANQWQNFSRGIAADLGDQTGSERNAALMPGARASSSSSPSTTRTPRPPSQRLPTRWDSRPSTSADCMTPDVSCKSAAARRRGFAS